MANQNLSQFGEKLFVADADHTFIWDTAASISKRVSRNSWLNSGTLTSDAPVTISQTWNAGSNVMTALKVVATDTASGATSNLLELWAGSTPALDFAVTKAGVMQAYGTYSSAGANYARLALACDSSGNATILTQAAGSGVAGSISIGNAQKIIAGAPNNVTLAFLSADANGVGLRAGASNLEVVRGDAGAFANLKANDLTLNGSLIVSNTPITSNSNIAGTNIEATSLIVTTTSNGTTAAGFGTRLLYRTETDTNVLQDSGAISSVWSNTVNANRTSDMLFYNVLNGTLTERMRILGASGNVGIGTNSPTSKLQVSAGDVEVDTIAKGVILKSPDGTRYRITVPNGGASLTITAV